MMCSTPHPQRLRTSVTPKEITTPKTPRLQTPKPSTNTTSQKTTRMETPQPVLDGLPTIEDCRKLKTRSASSSSSSSASSKSSCSGMNEDVKHLRKAMDSILRNMKRLSATNQQFVRSMVNLAGKVSTLRTPATQITAPAPAKATTASPQEKILRRVVDRSRHHHNHYLTQRHHE